MSRHNERNPNLDPNMLLILLLILSAYSRKPIYYCDKELLNNQHNKASENNDVSRASDIGYTGGVLSEDDDSHYEADSNRFVNVNSLNSNRKEDTHYKVDKLDENMDEHIEADSNFVYHSSLVSSN